MHLHDNWIVDGGEKIGIIGDVDGQKVAFVNRDMEAFMLENRRLLEKFGIKWVEIFEFGNMHFNAKPAGYAVPINVTGVMWYVPVFLAGNKIIVGMAIMPSGFVDMITNKLFMSLNFLAFPKFVLNETAEKYSGNVFVDVDCMVSVSDSMYRRESRLLHGFLDGNRIVAVTQEFYSNDWMEVVDTGFEPENLEITVEKRMVKMRYRDGI